MIDRYKLVYKTLADIINTVSIGLLIISEIFKYEFNILLVVAIIVIKLITMVLLYRENAVYSKLMKLYNDLKLIKKAHKLLHYINSGIILLAVIIGIISKYCKFGLFMESWMWLWVLLIFYSLEEFLFYDEFKTNKKSNSDDTSAS